MITLPEPIQLPSKTYDSVFVQRLTVIATGPQTGSVFVELRPYNSATGEIAPEELTKKMETGELSLALEEVPEMLAAYNAVLTAVPPMQVWSEARQTILEEEWKNKLNE